MSLSTKILLALAAIFIVIAGGFFIYKQVQLSRKLDDIQKSVIETKQLADSINRAQAEYATKQDIEEYAKQQNINLDVIRKDLATLGATVQGINGITVISKKQTGSNIPSNGTTPNPNPVEVPPGGDPFGYLNNRQVFVLNEQFSNVAVPFGTVGFSAWKDKPWDMNIESRKYSITSVLGMDKNGRHYTYSKFAIQTGGKTYDVNIDDNKFLEEYPTSSFSWWNPRLFMFANGGVGVSQTPIRGEFTPGVAVGIMSYGQTKTNPTLSVLQLGLGYGVVNKTVEISLSPVQYNVGKHIPLVNNTYIGPVVQVNNKANVSVGAGLSVGF